MRKTYQTCPPKEATVKSLYANANGRCSFDKPNTSGSMSYVSEPTPYRTLPIETTYSEYIHWRPWQVED